MDKDSCIKKTSDAVKQYLNILIELIDIIITYPMEYAKVLMQIGFEPVPPSPTKIILGRSWIVLPNVFKYIAYIRATDGNIGCYNGMLAKVVGHIASFQLTQKIIRILGFETPEVCDPPNIMTDAEPQVEDYKKLGRRLVIVQIVSNTILQPFNVVSIRMMASFVGGDEQYSTVCRAVVSVYRENGISGFFRGLTPKILGNIITVTSTVVFAYYVNKYLVSTKENRCLTVPVLAFMISTVTYPLSVVSTCMSISGCSLTAGSPPSMPNYPSWEHCWRDLFRSHQHKRGCFLIFRYQPASTDARKGTLTS